MTKKNKTDEDIDINLDDITGKKTSEVAQDAIKEAVDFLSKKEPLSAEETDWQVCVSKLKEATSKTWICIPVASNDKLYIQLLEIEKCTGQQFLDWLHLVYPLSITMASITAEACDTLSYRESLFEQVRKSSGYFRFPKTALSTNL